MAAQEDAIERRRVGLCYDCRHMRRITSDRGSQFYLCQLSFVNANFAKYPTLPVVRCPGYERREAQAEDSST
jgi:hypothetical protein